MTEDLNEVLMKPPVPLWLNGTGGSQGAIPPEPPEDDESEWKFLLAILVFAVLATYFL